MPVRKVLVLSGLQIFPPESGGQLRTSSLIGALVRRGFEVTVYSMVGRKREYLAGKPSATEVIREGLREHVDRGRFWAALQFCAYRLGLPPLWIPAAVALHRPRELRELLDWCDAVIADFPFLYPVANGTDKPVALNTHNVEADLWQRNWVKRCVAAIERRAARRVQRVFCCSEADRDFFLPMTQGGSVSVVPNGVDTSRFIDIASERDSLRSALGYSPVDRVLLFTASSFGPNVEALKWLEQFEAENRALLARKNLRFLVAGSVSKTPFERPFLKVVGTVDRIEPYFAAADLGFNCVLRGSGTNLKMAEFIAAGLPIITTTSGMRGYNLTDGEDCITFTPATLADVLDRNDLNAPDRLVRLARSAYEKNKHQIDMNWCIEPLVGWLQTAS